MNPITIPSIPFELDNAALRRAAHVLPDDTDYFDALIEIARQVARPKAIYTEAFVEIAGSETVRMGGRSFTSAMLRQNLEQVERVFPFVVTCGREMDTIELPPSDLLQQYWLDTIKESLLHAAFQHLHDHLERVYRLPKTASMSPGSGEADVWPIEQQRQLFSLLGDVRGQIGVELTDSFLMIPNKTVSGIHFPTEKDFRTCQVCQRENCPSRSAAFDPQLWESIHTP